MPKIIGLRMCRADNANSTEIWSALTEDGKTYSACDMSSVEVGDELPDNGEWYPADTEEGLTWGKNANEAEDIFYKEKREYEEDQDDEDFYEPDDWDDYYTQRHMLDDPPEYHPEDEPMTLKEKLSWFWEIALKGWLRRNFPIHIIRCDNCKKFIKIKLGRDLNWGNDFCSKQCEDERIPF